MITQGGEAWRSTARRANRDPALRELASRFSPGQSVPAQAKAVARFVRRYAATRWQRVDQHRAAMPAAYVRTPSE